MVKITFLGTSSSIPTAERDNTALFLRHKKNCLLIDCPGAVSHKLLKAGVDYTVLDKVVLTHHHPDHIYGIVHLIHSQYKLNKKISLFTSPAAKKMVKKLIRLFRLDRPDYPKINFIDVLEKKFFYSGPGLKIRALRNCHSRDSFGLLCQCGKRSLVYSSDTRPCPQIIQAAFSSDYLIHDCTGSSSYFKKYPKLADMHTDARTLCETFRDSRIKKIIPVHFLLLRKGEETRIKKELAPLGKKLFFPSDFDTITF